MGHLGWGQALATAAFLVVPGVAVAEPWSLPPQPASERTVPEQRIAGLPETTLDTSTAVAEPGTSGGSAGTAGKDAEDPDVEPLGLDVDPGSPVVASLGTSGIPKVALRAYVRAQETVARDDPGCRLQWPLLAGIGRVESNHGRYGGARLRRDGSGTRPIRGIPLDGRPGVAQIRDTDRGRFDGDTTYDRAVGPMQFIPSTWRSVAADGNGDGTRDPNNIFDAALGAARYLCSGGADLSDRAQRAAAVYRYNRSGEYVDLVLSLAAAYGSGLRPDLPDPGPATAPTEPVPEPVPDPAHEGTPPALSRAGGGGRAEPADAGRSASAVRPDPEPDPEPEPEPDPVPSTTSTTSTSLPPSTTTSSTTTTTVVPSTTTTSTTTTLSTTSTTTTTTAPTTTTTTTVPPEPGEPGCSAAAEAPGEPAVPHSGTTTTTTTTSTTTTTTTSPPPGDGTGTGGETCTAPPTGEPESTDGNDAQQTRGTVPEGTRREKTAVRPGRRRYHEMLL